MNLYRVKATTFVVGDDEYVIAESMAQVEETYKTKHEYREIKSIEFISSSILFIEKVRVVE
jgi:hypothetical protein